MRKNFVLLLALALLVCLTATAASGKVPVGDKIRVRNAEIQFPEAAPFYISHGWYNPSNITGVGLFEFALDVDGARVRPSYISRSVDPGEPDTLLWLWVYNFPDGMTGTHTFTGHWTGSCQGLVDMDVIEGPCEKPNEIVESNTATLTIEFVP